MSLVATMKQAQRRTLIFDAVAAVGLLAGVALSGVYWIRPHLAVSRERRLAVENVHVQQRNVRLARTAQNRARVALADLQSKLRREDTSVPPLSALNDRIARLTSLAEARGVIITETQPGGQFELQDLIEARISFRATGTFESFRLLMRAIEHEMPFVEVTHYSIGTELSASENSQECRLSWVVRAYFQKDHRAEPVRKS
jgi:hypothetical protein